MTKIQPQIELSP